MNPLGYELCSRYPKEMVMTCTILCLTELNICPLVPVLRYKRNKEEDCRIIGSLMASDRQRFKSKEDSTRVWHVPMFYHSRLNVLLSLRPSRLSVQWGQ